MGVFHLVGDVCQIIRKILPDFYSLLPSLIQVRLLFYTFHPEAWKIHLLCPELQFRHDLC